LEDVGNGVVMIEDAHWLDAASWSLVTEVLLPAPGLTTMLFARPLDRASVAPRVAAALDRAALRFRLGPLAATDVAQLIGAQLGTADAPALLTRTIAERTEGNPLFVQQLLGALVDSGIVERRNSGVRIDADALSAAALPDSVHGAIVARLDRLGNAAQVLLKVASVIGRDFDDALLARVAPSEVTPAELPRHLAQLAQRGLLERRGEGAWRFAHAVVRDAAYELLPLPRRRALHAAVGAVLDATRGDDAATWGRLAWHWTEAHDPVRAPAALERAGEAALRAGDYEDARALFARLLDLAERGFDDATATPLAATEAMRAHWWWKRGLAEYDIGALVDSRRSLEAALRADQDPVPATSSALGVRLLTEAARQALGVRVARIDEPRARRIAAVLNILGRIYHLSQQPNPTLYTILRRANVMHGRAPSAELMTSLSGLAYLNTLLGRHTAARTIDARLRGIHDQIGEPLAYADALYPITVSQLGQGRWDECARDTTAALDIVTRFGDRKGRMALLAVLANLEELRGNFPSSDQRYGELDLLARETADQVSALWAAGGLAMIAYRRGHLDGAQSLAERALALAIEAGESVSILSMDGLLAMIALRRDDQERARAVLRDAWPRLQQTPRVQTAHHTLNGFDTLAEACLTLWQHDAVRDAAAARRQWAPQATLAVTRLAAYARTFPIGRTIAATWRGTLAARQGNARGARTAWADGLAAVERVSVPFNAARLHAELAAHPDITGAEAAPHRERALAMFRALGAAVEVARVSRLGASPAAASPPSTHAPAA
nr:hypothetical protein [Gemmatimonadaceae bacterium]